jgi:hypothetical protein
MAGRIFVNYRRDDDPGYTQALFQKLIAAFPSDEVFMDVQGEIRPGEDFVSALEERISGCDVLLAVIGPRWLERDRSGRSRLDNEADFVRNEIDAALKQGKWVIPVLVNNGAVPSAGDLPECLRPFVRCNAGRLSHEQFSTDCQNLITNIRSALAEAEKTRKKREIEETLRIENEQVEELAISEILAHRSLSEKLADEAVKLDFTSTLDPDAFSAVDGVQINLNLLKRCKRLLDLRISGASNSDLMPLSELNSLERLVIDRTKVSDLSPISSLVNLVELDARGCPIPTIPPLCNLKALKKLNLRNTVISDLSSLGELEGLEELNLRNTKISDLTPLRRLRQLRWLQLQGTAVTDIRPLADLEALEVLFLRFTKVSDVGPLQHLGRLRVLDLSLTAVRDIQPLSGLTALAKLDVTGLRVRNLQKFRRPGLEIFGPRSARP